ncbi:hypothetical protein Tco_0776407, partial [Tanacetum coccineum]
NMNLVAAKQVALNNALVPLEKRLKIEKCNARIDIKLSTCYPTFLIIAEVPKVYMHQFWNTIQKIKDTDAYRFKLDKKKFRVDTEVFHENLQICPILPNQEFDEPPSEDELVPFIQELGYSGKCDMLSQIHTDQMHQPWRTFAAIINRNKINLYTVHDDTLLGTSKFVSKTQDYQQYRALAPNEMINQDIKDSKAYKTYLDFEEPAEKPKQAKKPAKKSTTIPIAGVVIRDTPSKSVPKKKPLSKVDKGKGDGVGSQPKVPDEKEDKTAGTDKGTGTKPGVPDVHKYLSESENESWGDIGDDDSNDEVNKDDDYDVNINADGDKEASDSEKTDSDEDKNPNLNQNDDEEEEYEEECIRTPDSFELTKDDEEYEELYKDVNVRLKETEHEEEGKGDEEMTDAGRDDGTQQNTYEQVKDDEHLILTTVHDTQKTEVPLQSSSFFNEDQGTILPPLLNKPVKSAPTLTLTPKTATTTTSILALPDFSSMFGFDQRVSALERELSQLKQADYSAHLLETIKSQIPSMILPKEVSDYATPVIQSSITESLKNIVLAKSSSQPKSTYESAVSLTEFELKKILLDKIQRNKDKDEDPPAGSDQGMKKQKTSKDAEPSRGFKSKESKLSSSKGSKSQLKSSGKSAQAEEPVFEAADTKMPLNKRDDLESIGLAFNLLKGTYRSRVELEYHFEECYKAITDRLDWTNPKGHEYPFDLSKPLPLIEDQGHQVVPANYFINNDLEYLKGGSLSRKYTTSTKKPRLLKDQQLYKFREGDFPRLNLHDIEDILLLLVQKKLSNLERDVIYDLNVTLRMFTRRVVILKRVEDLQLGVESYQKKINITKPETFRNKLMRSDELYKFYDGTLTSVRRVLHDIASRLGWIIAKKEDGVKLDRKRSCIMIKAIDHQLFERRLIRNLEKFVSGREYEEYFRLLERTI